MSTDTMHLVPLTSLSPETRGAAVDCLRRVACLGVRCSEASRSPLGMGQLIAQKLASDQSSAQTAWIVSRDAEPVDDERRPAAWPLRYMSTGRQYERPLIYLSCSTSRASLRSAFVESSGRGLFMNTAEGANQRWPKGVPPEIPLWLAQDWSCIPYDPASAEEVQSIVRGALHALYVEGEVAHYYLALHDAESAGVTPSSPLLEQAYTGMYLVACSAAREAAGVLRLLGAGRALERVRRAAQMLQREWDVASEVWSCPSYTRLAREGALATQWNTFNPLASPRVSRLEQCLGGRSEPVIAVTDYAPHVAAQIGACLSAPFVALGAGSQQGNAPACTEWIVLHALRALVEQGRLPAQVVADAVRRYRLS